MRKFVFATHGVFAEGIKNSVEMILGKQEGLKCICAYTETGVSIGEQFKRIIQVLEPDDELVILTDLFGGSVNNELYPYIKDSRVHLVSGLNLALAIQVLIGSRDTDIREIIRQAIDSSKEGIIYCNENKKACDEDNF